jgi:hypothetical protein
MNNDIKRTAREPTAIRPFHFSVAEAVLTELCRRISATRWLDRETVRSRRFRNSPVLGTEYSWRKVEALLNALQQFVTEIDDQGGSLGQD